MSDTFAFKNDNLSIDELPRVEVGQFESLQPGYRKMMYIKRFLAFVLVNGALVGLKLIAEELNLLVFFILTGSVNLLIVYSFLLVKLGFPRKGFLLREKDLSYKTGFFFFSITTIPLSRIQHVELIQGPLAKRFHVASLKVYTAGGNMSDLSIPGIQEDEAEQLRLHLSKTIEENE